MRGLGVPPTVDQLGTKATTDFLKTVYDKFNLYSGSNNPTTTQVPQKQWILYKNTTTGEIRLWLNDGGVLKSILVNTSVPEFSFYRNGNQTGLTDATWNKVQLNTVDWDTNSGWDSVNFRYKPTVAGYYQFNGAAVLSTTTSGNGLLSALFKNGTLYANGCMSTANTNLFPASTVSTSIQMNGTTDYVELQVYPSTGAAGTLMGDLRSRTYLSGFLIRPT